MTPPIAPVPALLLALFALAASAPALAQNALSSEGNAGITNPYATPTNDLFALAMASGDFDGNGIADIAVADATGTRVRVYRGVTWTVGASNLVIKFVNASVATQAFDGVLAVGDFDGDGRDELALGAESANVGGASYAGAVYVYDRSANGIWSLQETISLGQSGYGGFASMFGRFGAALTVGNFNGDAYLDLAIGQPSHAPPDQSRVGRVMVAYGSPSGITSAGHRFFDRGDPLVPGQPDGGDQFGYSLASADFDDDGYDDLAIGAPGAHCQPDGSGYAGGGVAVLRGAPAGLTAAFSQWFAPGYAGVPGVCAGIGADALLEFGSTLAAGRLTFDLNDDLLISAARGGTAGSTGSVVAVFGQAAGLDAGDARLIRATDMPEPVTSSSRFGETLQIANLRSGAFQAASIVIGAPGDRVDGVLGAGSVWVVHATANRPDPTTAQRWSANSRLALGPIATPAEFGATLAVGDFNGDGLTDLAAGAPEHDRVGEDAGALQVIYQSGFIFRDGFQ